MENLRYSLPFLDVKSTGPAGIIQGIAATWDGPPDMHGDIIERGAFEKSLAEHEAAGTRPALLWGHSQSDPIGKWIELRVTSVKSLNQVKSITEYQSFLHDLGLSVRESKRLARSGWSAYRGDELDEAEVAAEREKSRSQPSDH